MNTRFLVHTILAAATLAGFNAHAADLQDVYTRALTSDPLIREADANRLAARESKPQAIAALLPQVNGDGQLRRHRIDSNRTRTSIRRTVPLRPTSRSDGDSTNWRPDAAPERVQLGELGDTQARRLRAGPGRSRLSGRPARPDPADVRSLLQRAGSAGHARSRASRARRHRAPARTVREALRGRPDCRDGRAGRQGGIRLRNGRIDPGQAQPRDQRRDPARADRRRLGRARKTRQ